MSSSQSQSPDQSTIASLTTLIHTWADSMDTKSWSDFSSVFAPTISVDYSAMRKGGLKSSAVPSVLFARGISAPSNLGNPDLRTQHFIGGALSWSSVGDEQHESKGDKKQRWRCKFQIRAAHSRILESSTGPTKREITANAHGVNTMEFEQINDDHDGRLKWKIVSVKVDLRWVEGDLDEVFGRGESRDKEDKRGGSKL